MQYLCVITDGAIIVGEEIGQLGKVHLGCGFAGETVESTPPALELLVVDFGSIFRDGVPAGLEEGSGSEQLSHRSIFILSTRDEWG